MRRVVFEVPAINPKLGLDWDTLLAHEHEVGFTNPMVLSHLERAEASVQGAPGSGEELQFRLDLNFLRSFLPIDSVTALSPSFLETFFFFF